jgi:predicted RNase H-like HicB family nuclease
MLASDLRALHDSYQDIYEEGDGISCEMIEEVVEELIQECVEFGYTLDEASTAVQNAAFLYIDEAKVTYGSDTESPEQRKERAKERLGGMKSSARKAAVTGAVKRVQAKAKGAKAAAGIAASIAKDEARRAGRAATHAVSSTVQKKKAEVKGGIKKMIGGGLRAAATGIGKVAQRAAGAASRLGEKVEIEEGKKQFPHKKVDRQVYDAMDSGETAGDSGNRAKETRDYARADKMRSVAAKHGGKSRMKEEVEEISEAEGSYGQTPKATAAYGKLANKRRETPASGFAKRGDKTKQVKSAEKHHYRTLNPDAGNRGRKSTKPSAWSGKRSGMTQKDRDEARGGDEYGHTGYDSDFHGGPSAPGGKPKGKKAERQKKTGVSAESFDYKNKVEIYDVVLEYLLQTGHAETVSEAQYIMTQMNSESIQAIVETRMDPRGRPASGPMNVYAKSKPNTDPAFKAAVEKVKSDNAKKTPEQRKAELDAYIERQRNR